MNPRKARLFVTANIAQSVSCVLLIEYITPTKKYFWLVTSISIKHWTRRMLSRDILLIFEFMSNIKSTLSILFGNTWCYILSAIPFPSDDRATMWSFFCYHNQMGSMNLHSFVVFHIWKRLFGFHSPFSDKTYLSRLRLHFSALDYVLHLLGFLLSFGRHCQLIESLRARGSYTRCTVACHCFLLSFSCFQRPAPFLV